MANRAEGTTGLLQDFLVKAYGDVVGDDVWLSESGEPQGDGLIHFLHAEFSEVCESDDPTEKKLETLKKVVGDAIVDLLALQEKLQNAPREVKRVIASERTVSRISQAMPSDDAPTEGGASSGPKPF